MTRLVTSKGFARRRLALNTRRPHAAAAFAARIARRYARRSTRRGADLPLAHATRRLVQHTHHRHIHFGAVVSTRLTVAFHHRRIRLAEESVTPVVTSMGPQSATLAPVGTQPAGVRPGRDTLALRLTRRRERIETAPAGSSRGIDALGHSTAAGIAAPADVRQAAATMPLARPRDRAASGGAGAAAPERDDAGVGTEMRGLRSAHSAGGMRTGSAVTLPEREIDRLADRVIGSIDRRMSAQRERLGRC